LDPPRTIRSRGFDSKRSAGLAATGLLARAAKVNGAGREREARFAAEVDSLASVLGHADRTGPLMDYVKGLVNG
jgi:hypothetical protein